MPRGVIPVVLVIAASMAGMPFLLSSAEAQRSVSGSAVPEHDPRAEFAVGGGAMQRAQRIARRYWGQDPCGGRISLSWDESDPRAFAIASWGDPDGLGDLNLFYDCRIDFNADGPWGWPMFCTVMVHEYGHLLGLDHSADVHDVMYPGYREPTSMCKPKRRSPRAERTA